MPCRSWRSLSSFPAYFSLASSLFNEIPLAARELYYSHHRDVFSMCVTFLILGAIHSAGFAGRGLRAVLSWRPLYPIAQVSYSLYLVHEMVMLWLFPKTAAIFGPTLGPLPTMAAASAIAVAVSGAIAALLYYPHRTAVHASPISPDRAADDRARIQDSRGQGRRLRLVLVLTRLLLAR